MKKLLSAIATSMVLSLPALADDLAARFTGNIQCPDPGQQCRIVYLSSQEEKMLMAPNGVLDTAAQGRALDLGQFVVYFKQKLSSSAQGEVKPVPTDKPLDK